MPSAASRDTVERLDTIIDRAPNRPECFDAEDDVCGLLAAEMAETESAD